MHQHQTPTPHSSQSQSQLPIAMSLLMIRVCMQFTAGEPLRGRRMKEWNNPRCGSIFTAKIDGRSLYGKLLRFARVVGSNFGTVTELAVVEWFPEPVYPDGDPLLVRIDLDNEPADAPTNVLYLNEIDPSRVLYEIDESSIYMMRVEGLDQTHEF